MPRELNSVWNYFERVVKGRNVRGDCGYCQRKIYAVQKMRKHLSICTKAPAAIRKLYSDDNIAKYLIKCPDKNDNDKILPLAKECLICGSPREKNSLLTFHRFPTSKNLELRHAWLKACKLEENGVKPTDMLCSKHFREDDFDSKIWPARQLRLDAVPAPSTCYLKSKVKPASSPKSSIDSVTRETATRKMCKIQSDNPRLEDSLGSSKRNINDNCSYSIYDCFSPEIVTNTK